MRSYKYLGPCLQNYRVLDNGKTSVEKLHQEVFKLGGLHTEINERVNTGSRRYVTTS
jgi:hypothetical protein